LKQKKEKAHLFPPRFFSLVHFPTATSGVEESPPTHQEPEFG
jgi:hypothetical protein